MARLAPLRLPGPRCWQWSRRYCAEPWTEVEVISADGFGNRVYARELHVSLIRQARSCWLTQWMDQLLSRAQGLARLIVPSERDDALRQVKVGERSAVSGGGETAVKKALVNTNTRAIDILSAIHSTYDAYTMRSVRDFTKSSSPWSAFRVRSVGQRRPAPRLPPDGCCCPSRPHGPGRC
jgi:hypothetical protein